MTTGDRWRRRGTRWRGWALVASAALLPACGDAAASAQPSAFGADPASASGSGASDSGASGPSAMPAVATPSQGADDSPSNTPGSNADGDDTAADGSSMAGSEAVDPGLGLTPGADPSSGASSGTGGSEMTSDDGTGEPAPSDPAASEPDPSAPLTIYLAGDSIVQTYADTPSDSDQAGWGQMLHEFFDAEVTIDNRAIGGRTARRFIDEGRLDAIVALLEPGDYLLVQFGTNDGNRTATYTLGDATIPYFLDPATDFRAYLQRYIDAARSRNANPVFVTPTPRNSAYCTGGNGTGAHAAAMSALGQEQGVPVVDLNARSVAYLRAICPAPTPEDFFLLRADGSVDGTHFQENGARILASFVADGLSDVGAPFAAHRLAPP